MRNTLGNAVSVTLFGESHGEYIGAVIDGLAPGIEIKSEYISHMLTLRRPDGKISTPRKEKDEFKIVSGVINNITTGTPITILIPNENVKSGDYSQMKTVARPSHADYSAECKYHGYQDSRGGGHFSGRITAALVAAGAICKCALENKGIYIGTHVKKCAGISDREFNDLLWDINSLSQKTFAVLDESVGEKMKDAILEAASDGDSVGGLLETAIVGMPEGVGEPWFDTVESMLSHALFSVPAVKGVALGAGFSFGKMRFSIIASRNTTATQFCAKIDCIISGKFLNISGTSVKPTPMLSDREAMVIFLSEKPHLVNI